MTERDPQQAVLERGVDDDRVAPWRALDGFVDRAPTVDDLRAHRLHLVAAWSWRRRGRDVPAELVEDERSASLRLLAVESLIERIRNAYDGPLIVFKGYEVALRYPEPTLRPFTDIDVLVPEPERVSELLVAAGFEPVGYEESHYRDLHHVRPLCLPRLPIAIELHRRPEWVAWSPAPSIDELLRHAVPSRSGIDGVLAPHPAHHALLVAAHSWAGLPLRRVGDVVDAAVLAAEAGDGEVEEWAARWDVGGLWDFSERLRQTFFEGGRAPLAARLWGRSALASRDATVLEQHERRLLGPFAVLPPRRAARHALAQLAVELTPARNESWRAKLSRMGLALRHAFVRRSHHDARLLERRPPD